MMRAWSYGFMVLGGCATFYAAFILSPGIDAGQAGTVYNLAKAQDRELLFMLGMVAALLGGTLYAAAAIESAVMRAGGFRRKRARNLGQIHEAPDHSPDDDQVP